MRRTLCNKLAFDSKIEALDHLAVVRGKNVGTKLEKTNGLLHVYLCGYCNRYHAGHHHKDFFKGE